MPSYNVLAIHYTGAVINAVDTKEEAFLSLFAQFLMRSATHRVVFFTDISRQDLYIKFLETKLAKHQGCRTVLNQFSDRFYLPFTPEDTNEKAAKHIKSMLDALPDTASKSLYLVSSYSPLILHAMMAGWGHFYLNSVCTYQKARHPDDHDELICHINHQISPPQPQERLSPAVETVSEQEDQASQTLSPQTQETTTNQLTQKTPHTSFRFDPYTQYAHADTDEDRLFDAKMRT